MQNVAEEYEQVVERENVDPKLPEEGDIDDHATLNVLVKLPFNAWWHDFVLF